MAILEKGAGQPVLVSVDSGSVEARKARPALWWAGLGVVFAGVTVYSVGGWLLSGPSRTPTGPTPVPGYMWWAARVQEVAGPFVLAFMFWWFVVRPWRREGHITWDGLLFLACMGIFWQDPLFNYSGYWAVYNAVLINWGSWAGHIPGWLAPNGNRMVESPLWGITWYSYGFFGLILVGNAVMRKAKARWPRLGAVGLVGVAFLFFAVLDGVVEMTYGRLGMYTFAATIKSLTLFSGHYYQFPIYEMFTFGGLWAAMSCVRYFRNDQGGTPFERGLDRVRVGRKEKAVLRFFVLLAVMNSLFLGWSMAQQFIIPHAGSWNADTLKRSYFTEGLCGAGTSYACPGPSIPSPKGNRSIHVNPDGKLVVPAGTKLPTVVPSSTH